MGCMTLCPPEKQLLCDQEREEKRRDVWGPEGEKERKRKRKK